MQQATQYKRSLIHIFSALSWLHTAQSQHFLTSAAAALNSDEFCDFFLCHPFFSGANSLTTTKNIECSYQLLHPLWFWNEILFELCVCMYCVWHYQLLDFDIEKMSMWTYAMREENIAKYILNGIMKSESVTMALLSATLFFYSTYTFISITHKHTIW